jgi:hypothetical protein
LGSSASVAMDVQHLERWEQRRRGEGRKLLRV